MLELFSTRVCRSYFNDQYQAARDAWLSCVAKARANLAAGGSYFEYVEILHPLRGPTGEPLATDITWIGSKSASHVIGFISATHGIEGYAGSAIQHFLLDLVADGKMHLPDDTAILFIHGLNPWGMAWHRRCDEQGIDVNRNFIDFTRSLPDNRDYQRLADTLSLADRELRKQQLSQWRKKLGATRYEIAISGGQYTNPAHPFYGGSRPSFSNMVIDKVINDFELEGKALLILDLHTGLGAWGHGELICDHPPESAGEAYAATVFGDALTFPQRGTSSSVPKRGLLDYRWHQLMKGTGCYLTLEFGTYNTDRLFDRIIEDHQQWSTGADPLVNHALGKDAMLAHFAPHDAYWQQAILFKAWQTATQSLATHRSQHD